MKPYNRLFLIISTIFLYTTATSQTLYSPATGTSTTTGVGIGTNAPVGNFHIKHPTTQGSFILEGTSSNIGGQVTGPAFKLMTADESNGTVSKMEFLIKPTSATPTNTTTWQKLLSMSPNQAVFETPLYVGTSTSNKTLTVYGNTTHYGNVTIGCTSANKTLTINGNTTALGDIVIGSSSVGKNLTVNGSNISKQFLVSTPLAMWETGFYAKAAHAQAKLINLKNSADADIFNVWGNGNVNVKLLFAEEIRVTANAMNEWWDKVFLPDYELKTLGEVETFIKANRHLPDLPSENEVKTQGYNMQQMDGLLLKKIEELTLYIIELQKQIKETKSNLK